MISKRLTRNLRPILEEEIKTHRLGRNAGVSCLVAKAGKTLSDYSVGFEDGARPITGESHFRLASITKQFTSAGILRLIDDGKLSFETTLTDVYSDFPFYGREITIKNLLTHTSGLIDYETRIDKIDTYQISDEQVLSLATQEEATLFAPGSRYQYSNGAYCILACIIQKISGQTYPDYIRMFILQNADMPYASFDRENISSRVYGNEWNPETSQWEQKDQDRTSATQGDGGLYASAKELIRWQESLYRYKKVLPDHLLRIMTAPLHETDEPNESYGCGLFIENIAGQLCYRHGGESVGFRNALFYFPEEEVSLVLLSNQSSLDMNEVGHRLLTDSVL